MSEANGSAEVGRMVTMLIDGLSVREIAARRGVSYQSVYKLLAYYGIPAAQIRKSTRTRKAAETQLRLLLKRAERAIPCVVCGCWVLRAERGRPARKRTCSTACAHIWQASGRFALDEDEWAKHQLQVARWTLANPTHPSVTEYKLRYAQRVLDGAPIQRHGRWHIPGSAISEQIARVAPERLQPAPK